MKSVKEYKDASEIIDILKSRGMNFSQPNIALKTLNEINYFFLKGYQNILLEDNDNFKKNCDFSELTNLYFFDKELKALLLEYLLDIEQKIKTAISNIISLKYGINDKKYLQEKNYDQNSPYLESTLKTIKSQRKIYGEKNEAVKHYKSKYKIIPFYVLTKCLTFGAIRKLFNVMKQADQDYVCNKILFRKIEKRKISKVKQIIGLISDVRNMCAHDEIVYNYSHKSIDIGRFPEHDFFELKKNENGNIIQGRKDIFALLLCMKYLMNRTNYNKMIQRLESLINKTVKKSNIYTKNELLEYMNLPYDFEKIKQI